MKTSKLLKARRNYSRTLYMQLLLIPAMLLFAQAASAWTKKQVDNPYSGVKRETAVAVRLWKDANTPDDGKTIAAAYIVTPTANEGTQEGVLTSLSTNGGLSWSGAAGNEQAFVPDDGSTEIEDEKIAYRLYNGAPELVSVYKGGSPNVLLASFSTDDGADWTTTKVVYSASTGFRPRPGLACDNNYSSSYRNNAYVIWTDTDVTTQE